VAAVVAAGVVPLVTAAAQAAVEPPVAAMVVAAVSAAAGSYDPDGTPHSLHELQNLRIYFFFTAHTPIRDQNLVDESRDWG
jgi:hypothetical protein